MPLGVATILHGLYQLIKDEIIGGVDEIGNVAVLNEWNWNKYFR